MDSYRGTVSRVDTTGIYVQVPSLAISMEFGPCESILDRAFVTGDRVLVSNVNRIREDVVILGLLVTPNSTTGS